MKILLPILASTLLLISPVHGDEPLKTDGFHNDSEAGVVIASGNSNAQTYNLSQNNAYGWDVKNLFKFNSKFLETTSGGQETAKYWILGLRYERVIDGDFSAFLGQGLESDPFSGYNQRYLTDVGGKYFIYKEETFYWDTEAGYRHSVENRLSGQVNESFIRLFTEANRSWTKTFSTKLWVEYLPNLTVSSDYQFNTELSTSALINDVFSIKSAYLLKYRNTLITPATSNTDRQFTTALVAKF
jgi:putative salt-induced outer membrane protein